MATVEELLQDLIDVNTEIKLIEEGQTFQNETISSDIQTITSDIQTITSEIQDLKLQNLQISSGYVDETTPNYINQKLIDINNAQGAYTLEQTLANNESFYKDFVAIKETMTYQFIFLGVLIAFCAVILVVKGFFKHVSH